MEGEAPATTRSGHELRRCKEHREKEKKKRNWDVTRRRNGHFIIVMCFRIFLVKL